MARNEFEIRHADGSAAQVRDSMTDVCEILNETYGDSIAIADDWDDAGVEDGQQVQRKLVWQDEDDAAEMGVANGSVAYGNAVAQIVRIVK